jgi:hypothetical protein
LETDDNVAWRFLGVDGLGHGRLTVNLMQTAAMGNRFHGTGDWSVQASEGAFLIRASVLGGWRSADGELHDHWFLFVNSLAILFDLVPEDLAHSIMDRMLAKLKEVGFDRFDLGLPGNLVPVPKCDYVHHDLRWGGGACGDNSDGFQIYENGGATVCFAGFTIEALYKLGRVADGDRILFPMLEGFDQGNFQGPCSNGRTKDWRAWDGPCHGYEWLLADGYLTLRAALKRPAEHPLPAE